MSLNCSTYHDSTTYNNSVTHDNSASDNHSRANDDTGPSPSSREYYCKYKVRCMINK